MLTQNSIKHYSAKRTDKYQTINPITNTKHAYKNDNAFCLNRSDLQLPFLYPLLQSNSHKNYTYQIHKNNRNKTLSLLYPQGKLSSSKNTINQLIPLNNSNLHPPIITTKFHIFPRDYSQFT